MAVTKKAGGLGPTFEEELEKKDSALLTKGIWWDGDGNVHYPDNLASGLVTKLKAAISEHSKTTVKKYNVGTFRRVLSWFTDDEMTLLMTAVRTRNDFAERFFKLMARKSVDVTKGDYRRFIRRCAKNDGGVTRIITNKRKNALLAKQFSKAVQEDPTDADDS